MLVNEDLEIPGKYFSVARVYRPDVVDRTHLTEFHHLEGIILGEELTFRHLLGTLETFAKRVGGAEKVRFRPDYFPFTEPSVELAAYTEGSRLARIRRSRDVSTRGNQASWESKFQ